MYSKTILRHSSKGSIILVLFILIINLPALAGCASKSPEGVVAEFLLAIGDGNSDKAKRYCTQNFNNLYLSSLDAAMAMMPQGFQTNEDDKPSASKLSEQLESSISGNTANVWFEGIGFMQYVLIKEAGRWKIDRIDISMPDNFDLSDLAFPGA